MSAHDRERIVNRKKARQALTIGMAKPEMHETVTTKTQCHKIRSRVVFRIFVDVMNMNRAFGVSDPTSIAPAIGDRPCLHTSFAIARPNISEFLPFRWDAWFRRTTQRSLRFVVALLPIDVLKTVLTAVLLRWRLNWSIAGDAQSCSNFGESFLAHMFAQMYEACFAMLTITKRRLTTAAASFRYASERRVNRIFVQTEFASHRPLVAESFKDLLNSFAVRFSSLWHTTSMPCT
mgnify:CR=1 FL=1